MSTCHDSPSIQNDNQKALTIALVGNPNCGKSTLFNQLTGSSQRVGNWPGVTVDKKTGYYTHSGCRIEVIDLPGIYSLDNSVGSLDEKIAREYILSGEADLVINILDASSIERNLYLTSQLVEMRAPLILALNMMDVAKSHGSEVNTQLLGSELGCEAVPMVASKNKGVDELKTHILAATQNRVACEQNIPYSDDIEQAIASISEKLDSVDDAISTRWLAIALLESEQNNSLAGATESATALAVSCRKSLETQLDEDMDIVLANYRYDFSRTLANIILSKRHDYRKTLSDQIDSIILHKFLGVPIFLGVIYIMFLFTINFGGAFIDMFDQLAGAVFVDGAAKIFISLGLPQWLVVVLANGVGGGLQVVATFIPIIGFLYLFLAFLEDSGYMARAAFVVDRFMRRLGLPGKSFVPLIVGFGCNVPAIMATRTLDNHRERIITVLMAPFMSCGARLSVYALFAAAFFPVGGQNMVFLLYMVGIFVAMMTAIIIKYTLLPGVATPFLIELPAYHMPTLKGILLRTWSRLKGFLSDAGRIIILMVLVINVLNSWGTDGSFGNEDSENSVLSAMSKALTPIFSPLGIQQDNWPATVGIFTGILAKEVVVGSLDSIYSKIDITEDSDAEDEKGFEFKQAVIEAFQTVPDNLQEAKDNLLDPLGLRVLNSGADQLMAAEEQEVNIITFGAMVKRFDGQAGAFAYLLFILLYTPCVAVIGTIFKEAGSRWMLFTLAWSTGQAFMIATCFYQLARFSQHPLSSSAWVLGWTVSLGLVIGVMRKAGQHNRRENLIPVTQI